MPLPLLWIGLGIGALLGVGGTVATTDAADEIGGAVTNSADAIGRLTKTALLAGTAYIAYQHRADIMRLLK